MAEPKQTTITRYVEDYYKNMPSNVMLKNNGQLVITEPYWILKDSTITVGPGEHSKERDVWPFAIGKLTNSEGQPMLVQVPDTVTGPKIVRPLVHTLKKIKYTVTGQHKSGGNINYQEIFK